MRFSAFHGVKGHSCAGVGEGSYRWLVCLGLGFFFKQKGTEWEIRSEGTGRGSDADGIKHAKMRYFNLHTYKVQYLLETGVVQGEERVLQWCRYYPH